MFLCQTVCAWRQHTNTAARQTSSNANENTARHQTRLRPVPFLLYLPLLCQAPLQVSVPLLAGVQLCLQLLPRLTDRAHSQSESQPRADWRHTASFGSECNSLNEWWNRMLFKVTGILRLLYWILAVTVSEALLRFAGNYYTYTQKYVHSKRWISSSFHDYILQV